MIGPQGMPTTQWCMQQKPQLGYLKANGHLWDWLPTLQNSHYLCLPGKTMNNERCTECSLARTLTDSQVTTNIPLPPIHLMFLVIAGTVLSYDSTIRWTWDYSTVPVSYLQWRCFFRRLMRVQYHSLPNYYHTVATRLTSVPNAMNQY